MSEGPAPSVFTEWRPGLFFLGGRVATAVAVAPRPASADTIPVPAPRRLVRRMGLERIREYLVRLDEEAQHLEDVGGGRLDTSLDVHGKSAGGRIGDVYAGTRRKV
jgi:hypothetical protein